MKLIQMIYADQPIDFATSGEESVMVNDTQMAEAFGKRTDVFLKTDTTKKYIKALENFLENENNLPPNGGRLEQKIVENRGRNGIFFDRRLAIKFASWLDENFEVWIYTKIDQLILGAYRKHKLATIEKLKAKEELEQKKQQLIEEHPELQEYFTIENKIATAGKQQIKAIKDVGREIQMQFFT